MKSLEEQKVGIYKRVDLYFLFISFFFWGWSMQEIPTIQRRNQTRRKMEFQNEGFII